MMYFYLTHNFKTFLLVAFFDKSTQFLVKLLKMYKLFFELVLQENECIQNGLKMADFQKSYTRFKNLKN